MKLVLWIVTLLLSGSVVGCHNNNGGISDEAQKNLQAAKAIRESIEGNHLDKLSDFIATDCIDHAGDRGDIKGLDSIRAQLRQWNDMAEGKTTVIKELADELYVMSWTRNSGKYKSTGYGHKPGDAFELQSLEIIRFRDGKAVEHWSMMPPADALKMIAATSAPVTMSNAVIKEDSIRLKTKKLK